MAGTSPTIFVPCRPNPLPDRTLVVSPPFIGNKQGYALAFDYPYYSTQTSGEFRIVGRHSGRHQSTLWHETLRTLQREIPVPTVGNVSLTLKFP